MKLFTPIPLLLIALAPPLDFDSFTFKATDLVGAESNVATVTILSPGAKQGTLQASDVDEGDVLTFSIVSPPVKGTVTLDAATGAVSYTPKEFVITKSGGESGVFYTLQRSFDLLAWSDLIVFLTESGIYYDARVADRQFYRLWTP